jgi:hypothetical protein
MIITLIRTGGFTAIPIKKTINTKNLSEEESKKIEQIVNQSDFSAKEELPVNPMPDRFMYKISIEDEGKHKKISLDENSIAPFKKLISALENS